MRQKILDGKQIFEQYWITMGDARSINIIGSQLPINPITGKRLTMDAAYKAMWRWAARPENFQTAMEIVNKAKIAHGEMFNEEQFKTILLAKARWCLTKHQFGRWYGG